MKLNIIENKTPKTNGVLLYDGKSRINNENIIVIATGIKKNSSNIKTGDMVQTWILNKDENPIASLKNGNDFSICGDCKHRSFRSCYVNVGQAPYQVYKTFLNNKYGIEFKTDIFEGKFIRLGSYGDPAAVPIEVWQSLTKNSKGWTGYTHQWIRKENQDYKYFCMASCDTIKETEIAREMGWRPFYVRSEKDPIPKGFFSCPASKEENARLNCNECLACKGGEYKGQGCPTIIAHGPKWKKNFFETKINETVQNVCNDV